MTPLVGLRRKATTVGAIMACHLLLPQAAQGQWSRVYHEFYLAATHNWAFRREYPAADRLFNAFDYGHAILYEVLWTRPGDAVQRLEGREYEYLTTKLLVNPPRVPLEEMAIEPNYARLAPEAKAMFEWAHILHRQAYDVLADERLGGAAREAAMRQVLARYRSRPDLRFSERPKSMALMQEQTYSLAFRERFPKFNGLIWAYHWLQVGLYEPLVVGASAAERRALIHASVARFRQMLVDAPNRMPYVMPMTSAIAPTFAGRYPELAIIFDNLHSMHDVISDILANPAVPARRKRAEILLAASRFRDDTTEVMTIDGWRRMSAMMGLENQGGSAVGFLPALPSPTVARGAVMRHDRDGNMIGGEHAGHAMPAQPAAPDAHAGHQVGAVATDSIAALAALDRFHTALAEGDGAAVLDLLADDVELLSPAFAGGKDAYREGALAIDIAAARRSAPRREYRSVRVNGDQAWISARTASADPASPGAVAPALELAVLRRSADGWRIVALQRSPAPG